ncbi:MAG: translation initiation factor IF-2 subunit beta [Candidatus Marsarchaeota archaeon]|nr:translation initiation factor IF-2 subunit beta [Candidatus Marsarchaeota archaeon]
MNQLDKDYNALLDDLYKQVPSDSGTGEWFAVPTPNLRQDGDKIILLNFKEICQLFRRDPSHVMKFVVRHLATAGYVDADGRLVLQGRFTDTQVYQLLERYVNFFVKCPTCGRPDTRLTKRVRVVYMVCEACGAESAVKAPQ